MKEFFLTYEFVGDEEVPFLVDHDGLTPRRLDAAVEKYILELQRQLARRRIALNICALVLGIMTAGAARGIYVFHEVHQQAEHLRQQLKEDPVDKLLRNSPCSFHVHAITLESKP